MKRLSLKKIALVIILLPFLALADNSWNDTKDDSKSYYAGADNKLETLKKSCDTFCSSSYKVSKGTYTAATDKSEATCACGKKGQATLTNNE